MRHVNEGLTLRTNHSSLAQEIALNMTLASTGVRTRDITSGVLTLTKPINDTTNGPLRSRGIRQWVAAGDGTFRDVSGGARSARSGLRGRSGRGHRESAK